MKILFVFIAIKNITIVEQKKKVTKNKATLAIDAKKLEQNTKAKGIK